MGSLTKMTSVICILQPHKAAGIRPGGLRCRRVRHGLFSIDDDDGA
jgi:hypothetical protein